MPLQRDELVGQRGEHRIDPRRLGEANREHADLGPGAGEGPCTEARGEELRAQADAPERRPGANRLADESLLRGQPGEAVVLVGAHRPAHDDDAGEITPVREWIAVVEFDAVDRRSPLQQLVLEGGGGLAGDVLEDEEAVHRGQGNAWTHREVRVRGAGRQLRA